MSEGASPQDRVDWLRACLLGVLIALGCHIAYVQAAGPVLGAIPEWHAAHLQGRAPAPLQYRWLSFYLPDLLHRTGLPLASAYLLLRAVYLAAAMGVAFAIARLVSRSRATPVLVVLLLGAYYAAASQPYLQPAEEPSLLAMGVFALLALRRAPLWQLGVVMAAGALCKDTIGFLLPWYVLLRWQRSGDVRVALREGAALAVVFSGVYLGVRFVEGAERQYLGGLWQWRTNIAFLLDHPVHGLAWTLPSLVPLAVIAAHWGRAPSYVKCFVPTLVLFIAGHWAISRIEEFRTYAPLALVMWPAAFDLWMGALRQGRVHVSRPAGYLP